MNLQTITLDWKMADTWEAEIQALPALGIHNRIRDWINTHPQFAMNDDCQKHALLMFALGIKSAICNEQP